MADLIVANFIDENFLSGCVGAIAPEALRLYNLRTEPAFRWSPSYLVCIIPFIFIGGCVAWFLEPTTKWAAFYSGLTAPVLLSTALKDSVKAQKDLAEIQNEFEKLKQENNSSEEEINKLKQENEELQHNSKNLLAEIQNEFEKLKQKNKQLQAQILLLKKDEVLFLKENEVQDHAISDVQTKEYINQQQNYNQHIELKLKSSLPQAMLSNKVRQKVILDRNPKSMDSKGLLRKVLPEKNTQILFAFFLVMTFLLLAVTFTVLDIKIALLLLFLVLCNTLVAPRISKNKFFQEYFKGL